MCAVYSHIRENWQKWKKIQREKSKARFGMLFSPYFILVASDNSKSGQDSSRKSLIMRHVSWMSVVYVCGRTIWN